jgi:hypothetical protein
MDEQGEGAEPQRDRWSPQDQRTWVITFGATLAANVATVLVVGAALAFLHWARGNQPHHRLGASFWGSNVVALVGVTLTLLAARSLRRSGGSNRWWIRVFVGGSVLIVLVVLLDVIGAAAGIK